MIRRSDILRSAGEALYGERWQSPLSRELGVTDRTVRNWAVEHKDCPQDLAERLLAILRERGADLAMLIAAIEEHLQAMDDGPATDERKAVGRR